MGFVERVDGVEEWVHIHTLIAFLMRHIEVVVILRSKSEHVHGWVSSMVLGGLRIVEALCWH